MQFDEKFLLIIVAAHKQSSSLAFNFTEGNKVPEPT
jgi:hypothetical protein